MGGGAARALPPMPSRPAKWAAGRRPESYCRAQSCCRVACRQNQLLPKKPSARFSCKPGKKAHPFWCDKIREEKACYKTYVCVHATILFIKQEINHSFNQTRKNISSDPSIIQSSTFGVRVPNLTLAWIRSNSGDLKSSQL